MNTDMKANTVFALMHLTVCRGQKIIPYNQIPQKIALCVGHPSTPIIEPGNLWKAKKGSRIEQVEGAAWTKPQRQKRER